MSDVGAKHTQGPWRVVVHMPGPNDDYTFQSFWFEVSFDRAYSYAESKILSEANARLIAAAPELLAELKYATELFDELGEDKLFKRFSAVIAKAEGSQSPAQPTTRGGRPDTGDQQNSPRVANTKENS